MREKKGYIVYILPGSIRFVETKDLPDANYKDHFISSNFSNAYSFTPDSNLTTVIEKIRVDTLFDENPEMTEHARLLKEVLVFPAEVKFMLRKTTHKQIGYPLRKFKMVYTGKLVDSTMKNF